VTSSERKLFDLTGKVAIVTGSSRGIGRAIATRLAEAGARVVVSSRKQPACVDVVQDITDRHGPERAVAIAASISSKGDLERLVETTVATFGKIDILVCNAASNPFYGPLGEISDDQFRKVLDNNILSVHWLARFSTPAMIEAGGGTILIISSVGGFRGSATLGAYNLSKAADMQLARNLAVELGPSGIRVNCIAPGLIRTDFSRAIVDDPDSRDHYLRNTPLRRLGEPDDIAGCAVFLASSAGAFVTGQTITVDGGFTIHGV
jgi:NAD(P)-dependent dehydrogenase (short-subunit alcohol dehydrogenase family)